MKLIPDFFICNKVVLFTRLKFSFIYNMIRQYLVMNCNLAISRYNFVNKTAAAVGFRIIRFLPYLVCGICLWEMG